MLRYCNSSRMSRANSLLAMTVCAAALATVADLKASLWLDRAALRPDLAAHL